MDKLIAEMRAELETFYDMEECSTPQDKIQALTNMKNDVKPDNFAYEVEEPDLVVAVINTVLDYEIARYRKTLLQAV